MRKSLFIIGLLLMVGCNNQDNNLKVSNQGDDIRSSESAQQTAISTDINTQSYNGVSENNVDSINNPFFFNSEITELNYSGEFMFNNIVKNEVKLNINEIAHLKYGKLYELKLAPIKDVPNERLSLGYFYVQKDKIYKIEATEENLNKLKESEEMPKESVVVCQDEEMKDSLGENEKGWHHYIEVNGDSRKYHSYNNLEETGYYESFTWEKNKGLTHYSSGYGAERDSIEINIQREINNEDVMNRDNIIYVNTTAGFKVNIPKSWEGKYKVDEWDKGTRFIHLIDGNEGDILFSVSIFGSLEEWNENGTYPYEYIGESGGKVYVLKSPSESGYDYNTDRGQEYIAEYNKLWEDLGDITNRVEFTDNNKMN